MTNPLNIHPETFVPRGRNAYDDEVGTILVGKDHTTVPAVRHEDGSLSVSGFVGRYRTSNKPWSARVVLYRDGRLYARFGRDDRAGRFAKDSGISFEPGTLPTDGHPFWTAA